MAQALRARTFVRPISLRCRFGRRTLRVLIPPGREIFEIWTLVVLSSGGRILEVAEREGFEPPLPLPVNLISSQTHSTTLPSLLTGRVERRPLGKKRKQKVPRLKVPS